MLLLCYGRKLLAFCLLVGVNVKQQWLLDDFDISSFHSFSVLFGSNKLANLLTLLCSRSGG
jgi:hypothetical protein